MTLKMHVVAPIARAKKRECESGDDNPAARAPRAANPAGIPGRVGPEIVHKPMRAPVVVSSRYSSRNCRSGLCSILLMEPQIAPDPRVCFAADAMQDLALGGRIHGARPPYSGLEFTDLAETSKEARRKRTAYHSGSK